MQKKRAKAKARGSSGRVSLSSSDEVNQRGKKTRLKKAGRLKRAPLLDYRIVEAVYSAMAGKEQRRARAHWLELFAKYEANARPGVVKADRFAKCLAKIGVQLEAREDYDALACCFTRSSSDTSSDAENSSDENNKRGDANTLVDYVAFVDFACNVRDSEKLSEIAELLRKSISKYDGKKQSASSYSIAEGLVKLDRHQRGWITSTQFERALERTDRGPTFRLSEPQVAALVDRFEYEYEKQQLGIDYVQFAQWLQPLLHLDVAQLHERMKALVAEAGKKRGWKLGEVFEAMDEDGDGEIDAVELKEALLEMGLPLTDAQIRCLADEYDADGDGKIQYNEFLSLFASPGKKKAVVKERRLRTGEKSASESTTTDATKKRKSRVKRNVRNSYSWGITKAFARKQATQSGDRKSVSGKSVAPPKAGGPSSSSSEENNRETARKKKRQTRSKESDETSSDEEAVGKRMKTRGGKTRKQHSESSEGESSSTSDNQGKSRGAAYDDDANSSSSDSSGSSSGLDVRQLQQRRGSRARRRSSYVEGPYDAEDNDDETEEEEDVTDGLGSSKEDGGEESSRSDDEYHKHLKRSLRRAFDFFDLDQTATIDKRELSHVLRALGHEFTSKELEAAMASADLDRNGRLDFYEFVAFVKQQLAQKTFLLSQQREMEIRQSFQSLDADKNGALDEQEFEYLIYKVLQVELSVEEQSALLDFADRDADGLISEEEFIAFMKNMETFHLEHGPRDGGKRQKRFLASLDGSSQLAYSAMKKLVRGAPMDLDRNLLMFFGIPSNFRPAISSAATCRALQGNTMEHVLSFPSPQTIEALALDPRLNTLEKRDTAWFALSKREDASAEYLMLQQAEGVEAQAIVSLKRAAGVPKPFDTREDDVVKRCVHVCLFQEQEEVPSAKPTAIRTRKDDKTLTVTKVVGAGVVVGNVHEIPVYWHQGEEDVWEFSKKSTKQDKYKFLVRTNAVNDHLYLLVEFIVHLKLNQRKHRSKKDSADRKSAAKEEENESSDDGQKNSETREMVCCWSKIPVRQLLAKRSDVMRRKEKLWGGTAHAPVDIEQDELLRRRTGWRALTNMFTKPSPPLMGIKSVPIDLLAEELQHFVHKMPSVVIAPFVSLPVVAEYMTLVRKTLACVASSSSVMTCEPVLKLLPKIVDDHEALSLFRQVFDAEVAVLKASEVPMRQLKFQELVLRMWPAFVQWQERLPPSLLPPAANAAGQSATSAVNNPPAGVAAASTVSKQQMDFLRGPVDGIALSEGFPVGGFRLMVALAGCSLMAPFIHLARSESSRAWASPCIWLDGWLLPPVLTLATVCGDGCTGHLFNVAAGMLAGVFVFDWAVLHTVGTAVVVYLLMMFAPSHYYREFHSPDIIWDSAQMILTLKLSSVAINYSDGGIPREKKTPTMLKNELQEIPALLPSYDRELPLGFIFFFPTYLAGPAFEYKDYLYWMKEIRGLSPGYYLFFLLGGVYIEVGKREWHYVAIDCTLPTIQSGSHHVLRLFCFSWINAELRRRLRPFFHYTEDRKAHSHAIFLSYFDGSSHPLAFFYDVAGVLLTWVAMQYAGVAFEIMDVRRCLAIWGSWYFLPHLVCIGMLVLFNIFPQRRAATTTKKTQ
ncbi:hypothetical protein BBJ28_00003690 [Nothophytophthora sp. Chile5]|nr:hypothetical protein BBJ28_00003690 [Nothophytophthora sp. Chile5]